MRQTIRGWLESFADSATADDWSLWLSLAAIVIIAWVCYLAWSKVMVPVLNVIISRTNTSWDDEVLAPEGKVLPAVGQLLPALIVSHYLPEVVQSHADSLYVLTERVTNVYIVWAVWFLVNRIVKQLYKKFVSDGHIAEHSSKGLLQMFTIIVACIAAIIAVSIMLGRSVGTIVAALGASTAVLMLVFKDTIMGLVAGVQLSANKMLKKGDWIIVERAGINGEVEDVSLNTVKVRNWDESTVTIPPYVLISESFQNFATMRDIGGRRVMRHFNIDLNSIHALSASEAENLPAAASSASAANIPNITVFRHWLEEFLPAQPHVRTDMRLMVRQLQPESNGLPLEVFFFVDITEWTDFERIQADITDAILAAIPRFGLRLHQSPTGADISRLVR